MVPETSCRLLVAAPELLDPNFARTVVFMIDHTPDGALGLVLNRPSRRPLDDLLPKWAPLATTPDVLFVGGPARKAVSLVGIGRTNGMGDEPAVWHTLFGAVGILDLAANPLRVIGTVDEVRVFAGYAGWGPEQLDEEIECGSWHVVDPWASDLFTTDPSILWRTVLRRQGGELAMTANYALDPTVN